MASFRKMAGGKWRAEIARLGVRASKVFPSKRAAQDWAARQEYLIAEAKPPGATVTFGEALFRYAKEVSPTKRGARWEMLRLERFRREKFAAIKMQDLTPADFAAWRDARLRDVAPGTVNREMTLLSGVLTIARKEWGLIQVNPISDVRKPTKPPPRDRLVTEAELAALAISAGDDLTKKTARAFHAFKFAMETAMRAGEITGLVWSRVDLDARVCRLDMTKNGTARDVPLSKAAVALLRALPPADPVLGLTGRELDALWRKLRDRAGVVDLTFHDSRHIAVTQLAQKIEVLDLARMTGHRNISELLSYYNAKASDIARRLD